MQSWLNNFTSLSKKIGLLLFVYTICRILFYLFNFSYFSDLSFGQTFFIMLVGIRFDLSAVILSNSFFIIFTLLPFPFRESKVYKTVLKWLFLIVNSLAILANCVDLIYFQFTLKRTTADVFNFFGGGMGNDFGRLLPLFLKEYWYIFVIWIVLSVALAYFYKKIERKFTALVWNFKQYIQQTLVLLVYLVVATILYRGGFQLKPISAVDASEYTSVKNIPLVVSTPFTILKTLDVDGIKPSIYFNNEAELRSIYNPLHLGKKGEFKQLNVFVIALESFSKEYIGSLNKRNTGYTPFLDSLIGQSLTFTNAYSNGKTSITGIPAIVSSIPTWMDEAYITSPYGSNIINSLANTLKQKGYYTAFFHGGSNGTMGFDAFASLAGYTDYFGRTEYNNEKDYDGNWGIWDEEFFQYTAKTINTKKQPFFATLFTLTSHHPFPVPNKYKSKFKEGPLAIEHSIGYTDYALRQFFETAKKMPWFNNTLFVLSADHTGLSSDDFYANQVGNNAIPIIYYLPNSNLKRMDSTLTQQIDIMPSVLDYLNYPSNYFAFGNSVFDSVGQHNVLMYYGGLYQLLEKNYVLEFEGEKADYLYQYTNDSLLKNNIIAQHPAEAKEMEKKMKAIIQTYQQSLINNKMH
jgi:phosphoglycerol transferase MdoB-like AlkP superfamily enzyme